MIRSTFRPFPRLPTENRLRIWEMTVEPRTVELYCNHDHMSVYPEAFGKSSPSPAPASLHACRESRGHLSGSYQQIFLGDAVHCTGVSSTNAQQYLWLDWDVDTISIGTCLLSCFESIAPLIRKLKFERDNAEEYWCRFESQEPLNFKHVETIHVVCLGGDHEDWHAASVEYPWLCGPENVFIVDQNGTMRLTDVEDECDRKFEAAARVEDPSSHVIFRNGDPIYPHN